MRDRPWIAERRATPGRRRADVRSDRTVLSSPTAISSATPIGCSKPSASAAPITACCISSAANPGLTIAALLDILKITKQSLNRVLKELIAKNFIDARAGATDRRHRQLYATERAKSWRATSPSCRPAASPRDAKLGHHGARKQASRSCMAMIDAPERERVIELIGARSRAAPARTAE